MIEKKLYESLYGALNYLVKPIDKDELHEAVDRVIKYNREESLKQLTALLKHIRKSNDFLFRLHTNKAYIRPLALNDIDIC